MFSGVREAKGRITRQSEMCLRYGDETETRKTGEGSQPQTHTAGGYTYDTTG